MEQHVHSHSTELKNRILAQIPELKLIEKLCRDEHIVIHGGLHVETAVLRVIEDCLEDSGWVEDLVQAKVGSSPRELLCCGFKKRCRGHYKFKKLKQL